MPTRLEGVPLPMVATPLERTLWRVLVLLLVAALGAIIAAHVARWRHAEEVVFAAGIVVAATGIALGAARRRARRLLEANGFRVCPRCLSVLEAPLAGACARCGLEVGTPEDLEAFWRDQYRMARG